MLLNYVAASWSLPALLASSVKQTSWGGNEFVLGTPRLPCIHEISSRWLLNGKFHLAGNLTVAVQQVDFLTAMTRLKAMGWTTCQVEEMEESASSGNSSPDRLSFGSQQQNKTFSHGISTPLPTFDGSLAPQPQHATVLSGSGLDFSPVSPCAGVSLL